jgi:dienelactone hydrolase
MRLSLGPVARRSARATRSHTARRGVASLATVCATRVRSAACSAALFALGLATCAVGSARAQSPTELLEPGPYPVAHWDWVLAPIALVHPLTGGALQVNHYGRLHYPALLDGSPLPPLAQGGPFPLAVFGHGRFQSGPTLGNNHLQAGYLLDRLASWGIVATAVNLDVVGQFANPAAIPQRAQLLLATAERTLEPLSGAPAGLAEGLDPTRIALLGHSRGGEAAVGAALLNMAARAPLPVRCVATIAPTNFQGYELDQVPYLGLYGSKDGDVNNGWPIQLHDRVRSDEKVFGYAHGANHFWFTESITCSCEGNADFSRALHHELAMAYVAGFARRMLAPVPLPADVFAERSAFAPLTDQLELLPMYRAPLRLVLDDFELSPGLGWSSSHAPVALGGFFGSIEASLNSPQHSLYHHTRGFDGAWLAGGALWLTGNPLAPIDARAWPYLSVKFAQRHGSIANWAGQAQDVSLGLMDQHGQLALVRLSDYGDIPVPKVHTSSLGQNFPEKSVLRTTRVPLAAFAAANPALDLSRVLYTGWLADQSINGELLFDDLEFSQ